MGSAAHLKADSKVLGLIFLARKPFTRFQFMMGAGSVSLSGGLSRSSHSVEPCVDACVVGDAFLF